MAPREPPACSICLERPREPISLDCGHDFCPRCFSTHRVPGCGPPCCPECRKTCQRKKGLRGLGERMRLLPRRPLSPALQVRWPRPHRGCHLTPGWPGGRRGSGGRAPAWVLREPCLRAQETCAVRAEPLLLVRVNASGGLILRMGAINRCLKHPLARDTPVCLLAVLGERYSGKTFLLNHLLQGLPGLVRAGLGRGLGAGGWGRDPAWLGEGRGPDGPTDALLLCPTGARRGRLAEGRGLRAGLPVGSQQPHQGPLDVEPSLPAGEGGEEGEGGRGRGVQTGSRRRESGRKALGAGTRR